MESDLEVPLPLDPSKLNNLEERRLWVGNLDLRINEYQLLKLVQIHGKIEKFDLLFHRSGPQAGQPRGYAFVTYESSCDAEKAKEALNNKKIGVKNIVVRWAHNVNENEVDKPRPKLNIPALAGAKQEDKKVSRETAIQAIEAKLKMMNECEEEFELNKPLVGTPIAQQYQRSEYLRPSTSNRYSYNRGSYRGSRYQSNKPYGRSRPRR